MVLVESSMGEEVNVQEFYDNLSVDEINKLEWSTEEEAFQFYEKYGLVHGFGVRKDKYGRRTNGEVRWRSFVCACEGFRSEKNSNKPDRKRAPRLITRCGCLATLRIELNVERKVWIVSRFVDEHNHPILEPRLSKFHRSHCAIDDVDEAQMNCMHDHRMRTTHLMSYMADQSGGFSGLNFTRKDVYNHFDRQKKEKATGGDAMAAMSYLKGRAATDPRYFIKHTIGGDGCLENLFWADGISRLDYECFGDVVAFDSTYKKNKYNKPLVIFSGINNHQQLAVFACCLLSNESDETYKWVLETLVEAMDGKTPVSVVIDGDRAMRHAIVHVFPDANHRLCSWHLQQNAQCNVKLKQFTSEFGYLTTDNIEVEEFEHRWATLVENFNLSNNVWVNEVYSRRDLWSSAHLRGKLMCGTTSRCEGINSYVGRYVDSKNNLLEFIEYFHQALDSIRYNELQAYYNSNFGQFVLGSVYADLELSGAVIYTREAFAFFQVALEETAAWHIVEFENDFGLFVYKVKKYRGSGKQYKILYDQNSVRQRMQCDCSMFQSYGMPCPHLVCVLVNEDFDSLPPCLVHQRWMKDVKRKLVECSEHIGQCSRDNEANVVNSRMASLGHSMRWLSYLASKCVEDFNATRKTVHKMIVDMETKCGTQSNPMQSFEDDIRDPPVMRSKGRPVSKKSRVQRARKCSLCKLVGHTRSNCSQSMSQESHQSYGTDMIEEYL